MAHRSHDQMSDTEVMLLQSVRAEFLFVDGPGGKGGQEEAFKDPLNPLKPFKLVPTSSGLPDPTAQQALLHPLGSRHSASERAC